MGHQISTKTQLGVSTKQNIQEKYYTNLFIKNLKSSHQFRKQLNSVCKRSSYLHYEWAQLLQTELKTGDLNKLYSEYQTTLKENCLREGKKEKIFCPTKIQRQFICRLDKQSKEETQMTAERLNKAFEQTKSYLMVMSWLHKMVTLSAKDQENKSSNISQEWDLNEEEHIYEILFNLAQKTFRKVRRITPIKQCQNKSELSNLNLTRLIKKLTMQKLSFFEKQTIIAKIQEQLQVELIKLEQNVSSMKNILGEEVIYGHLRTVREVGHFDIDFLWKFFGEELS